MVLPLSILDLVPITAGEGGAGSGAALRHSLELVEHADRLGYTRYWFAEHHNMPSIGSTTPELLIALAAERSTRIRVGSGGVMLPNHAPLKVAEAFKMLEALHPGRIDLGIGRAPGTDPATAMTLRGPGDSLGADNFPAQLSELIRFGTPEGVTRQMSRAGAPSQVLAVPTDVPIPPIWLLGSSDYSANLAAEIGLGFGFAAHFSDFPPEGPMLEYRARFRPSALFPRPHAILTLSVICADTDEEAQRLLTSLLVAFARLRTGQSSLLLPPEEAAVYPFSPAESEVVRSIRGRHIVGSPATVRPVIERIAARTQADEVMISSFIPGQAARLRSYELVAESFA